MKKKKNQTSVMNRYLLIGLSVFCIFMMLLSSFSDKVGGPFKVVANVTVIPLQQGINQIGGWMGDMKDNFQTLKQVRAENAKLQKQVDSLITENNNLNKNVMSFRDCRNYISWTRTMQITKKLLHM